SKARTADRDRYEGLSTTPTNSTRPESAASRRLVCANSVPISGQSVVQTGSRKVSRTTLPRRLARLIWWLDWSVSVNPGARRFRLEEWPLTAWARIGSAFGLDRAIASGAAPSKITATAPTATTERKLAPASRPKALPGLRDARLVTWAGDCASAGVGRVRAR